MHRTGQERQSGMRRHLARLVLAASLVSGSPVWAADADLAAEWTFSEGGGVASDTSGHGNDGTLRQLERVVGERGPAIRFPSLPAFGAWVDVPAGPETTLHQFDTGLTLEALIKPDVLPPQGAESTSRIRYVLWGNDDIFTLALRANDPAQTILVGGINCGRRPTGTNDVTVTVNFPHDRAGVFTHVALTFADGLLRLFIGGAPVAQVQDGGTPPCGSRVGPLGRNLVRIGGDETSGPNSVRTFRGEIDDVRIWRRALSPEELAATAARPPCTSDADCDDGDTCTIDACATPAGCTQARPVSLDGARCEVEKVRGQSPCDSALVQKLERLRQKSAKKVLGVIERLARGPTAAKVDKLLARADRALARLDAKLAAGKLAERVDEPCRARLRELIAEARAALAAV
jgi:hypothetical protein